MAPLNVNFQFLSDGNVTVEYINIQKVRDAALERTLECTKTLSELPPHLSFKTFISHATAVGRFDNYKVFPRKCYEILAEVGNGRGELNLSFYLYGVLGAAIVDSIDSHKLERLPARVFNNQVNQLRRIVEDGNSQDGWLSLENDLFQKEFGLASLRLYAAGAQLVDYRCGIPRSMLLKDGVSQIYRKLLYFAQLGGLKPFFEIHTHKFNLEAFNEEGWDECYRCCAELYSLHPECRGMFGSSWFYDHALDSISPRLSYLRSVPTVGGAALMFVEDGGQATENALSTSPTRRKFYENGTYSPKSYMLIWGRKDQVAWAEKHCKIDEQKSRPLFAARLNK